MKPSALRSSTRTLPSLVMPGYRFCMRAWLMAVSLCVLGPVRAEPVDLGRLFYTPAQRAQLEAARSRNVTQRNSPTKADAPTPLRYDGVLIRSDGTTTRWVNGKPQVGPSGVTGLKPGQIRADGKVYEPYQVLRPTSPNPAEAGAQEAAP